MPITSPWAADLQPASFGGFSFVVRRDEATLGRRLVPHSYPFRDAPFLEDLGAAPKAYSFDGYLTGDDVHRQRTAFEKLLDTPGPKLLCHPSKGTFYALLQSASFLESVDRGRVIEVRLAFVVADDRNSSSLFPHSAGGSFLQSILQAANAASAAISSFYGQVTAIVSRGIAIVNSIHNTIQRFITAIGTVISSPMALFGAVRGLGSSFFDFNVNFGRYDQGHLTTPNSALLGLSQTSTLPDRVSAATSALLGAQCTNAALVASQATALASLDPTSVAFPQAVQTLLTTVCNNTDPADQIPLLWGLASFQPTTPALTGVSPITAAVTQASAVTATLCRRLALVALALATAAYNATSSGDVQAILSQLIPVFDAEVAFAADSGDRPAYTALRALRIAVVSDLQQRAAQLPELITYSFAKSSSAMVLAYRLYQDATRAGDLVERANPPSPLFMPLTFTALSA